MTPHATSLRLKQAIRSIMAKRGFLVKDLAAHLDLSLATAKRALAQEELSLSRLLAICDWLGITLADLYAAAEQNAAPPETYLTEAQEEFLAAEPRYLSYLHLLESGKTPAEIAAKYGLKRAATDRYLRRLEMLGLLRVTAAGAIKLAHASSPNWRPRGAMVRAYYRRTLERYAGYFVQAVGERVESEGRTGAPVYTSVSTQAMSRKAFDAMQEELHAVYMKYVQLGQLEEKLEGPRELGTTVALKCVTWRGPGEDLTALLDGFGEPTN
jgi:DNA-binding MarR family transcriptional regulator